MLGFDVRRQARQIRGRVGYVFGGDRGLYDRLSAYDNLRYFADLYRVPARSRRARIDELLELVDLKGRERERVETYSRGMKQRLHIARGSCTTPRSCSSTNPRSGSTRSARASCATRSPASTTRGRPSSTCTALGLCLGALGLRGRNVSVFADVIAAFMLLLSGANVPLQRLPDWIQQISARIPLTHGIAAARAIADGSSLGDVSSLLLKELAVGSVLLLVGPAMLRFFEYEGRRSASLETF